MRGLSIPMRGKISIHDLWTEEPEKSPQDPVDPANGNRAALRASHAIRSWRRFSWRKKVIEKSRLASLGQRYAPAVLSSRAKTGHCPPGLRV